MPSRDYYLRWGNTSFLFGVAISALLFVSGVVFGASGNFVTFDSFMKYFYVLLPPLAYILLDHRGHFLEESTAMEDVLFAAGFAVFSPVVLVYCYAAAAVQHLR